MSIFAEVFNLTLKQYDKYRQSADCQIVERRLQASHFSSQDLTLDKIFNRHRSIYSVDDLARRMVARNIHSAPLRHIYHRLHSLHMVEKEQKQDRAQRDELGRRHRLRPYSGLFRLQLHRSELSDTLIVA